MIKYNRHLVPPAVIDIGDKLNNTKIITENEKLLLIQRLETIREYFNDQLKPHEKNSFFR